MSILKAVQRRKLKHALGMQSGYVLGFTNETFAYFFADTLGIDICSDEYSEGNSGSKGQRLQKFFEISSAQDTLTVLEELDKDWDEYSKKSVDTPDREKLEQVISELKEIIHQEDITPVPLQKVENIHFSVAMSFPGAKRDYVSEVVNILKTKLELNSVFCDKDYQSQLAKPNLDTLLQNIYRNNSDLVVVFLCDDYESSQWCGLEWRAVRDIIKSKCDNQVMLFRFDDAIIDGLLSIDGYIDAAEIDTKKAAEFILERINLGISA